MRPSALLAAVLAAALLAWGFAALVPTSPGLFVLLLTAGTVGFGAAYGTPTRRTVDRHWRRLRRTRALAGHLQTRRVARLLAATPAGERLRRRIRSRADLLAFRRDAVHALLSHVLSAGFHLAAAAALAVAGRPGWAVLALVAGALLHVWPAAHHVELLGRVDELRASVTARRG